MKYEFKEDPFHLAPLWTGMLDIYREFAAICDRHGLRYYITDGNCIGILRHKGFIPWDDDFDVSMPRPDYEKFKKVAKEELPPHLKFVNWENTPEFNMLFGKIQDARREYVEDAEREVGARLSNGVFIDVFPVDGATDSRFVAWCEYKLFLLIGYIEFYRENAFSTLSFKHRLKWLVGFAGSLLFLHLKSRNDFMAFYERRAMRHPYGSTQTTGRASLCNCVKLRYPLQSWGVPNYGPYNGLSMPYPHDVDTHLKVEYPHYMELPPESKRKLSHTYDYYVPWWLGPTTKA